MRQIGRVGRPKDVEHCRHGHCRQKMKDQTIIDQTDHNRNKQVIILTSERGRAIMVDNNRAVRANFMMMVLMTYGYYNSAI